jgi:hypothetical protein
MAEEYNLIAQLNRIERDLGEVKHREILFQEDFAAFKSQLASTNVVLAAILQALTPPPPVAFKITFTGVNSMVKNAKATLDFQLADNGTATATISFVDAAGLPTSLASGQTASVPTWTPSANSLAVTPAANGLTAVVAPATPPVLATDVTIAVSAITITNPDQSTIVLPAVTSDGIDVVNSAVGGFAISGV